MSNHEKQTTIMNFINSPGAKLLRTTTPKKQQPGSPGLGKKMKTTSIKKPPKKTTKGIEQKTVKASMIYCLISTVTNSIKSILLT